VTCVPGELLNHHQQRPSHADDPFGGQLDGVVEIEPGGDGARSCASSLELVDDAGQCLVIIDGKGSYVASCVAIAIGLVDFSPMSLEPNTFCGSSVLDE
jgi:hypothetical protein